GVGMDGDEQVAVDEVRPDLCDLHVRLSLRGW
ncbi:MAG: hypothetical protein AVDCRST_MAG93-3093, partial [uncultured Chloroflexia bacterium]